MTEKVKYRSLDEKKYLDKRLRTIEGQVRGVRGMVQDDRYCKDILIQISAITKSLNSIAIKILKNHLDTCVVEDIKKGNLEITQEVIDLIKKLD